MNNRNKRSFKEIKITLEVTIEVEEEAQIEEETQKEGKEKDGVEEEEVDKCPNNPSKTKKNKVSRMFHKVPMRSHLLLKSNLKTSLQMQYLSNKAQIIKCHNLNFNSRFLEKRNKISQINKATHIKKTNKRVEAKIKTKNQICRESMSCAAGSNFKRGFRLSG